MKYAVFTVSTPEYTPEELLDLLVKYGYDGVEWRVNEVADFDRQAPVNYWNNNACTVRESTFAETIGSLCQKAKERKLETMSLGSYLHCGHIERAEKLMDACAQNGIPQLRISTPGYDEKIGYEALFERALGYYTVLQSFAEKYRVKVLIEMHMNNITPSASAARRLAEHFDPAYIGFIYDVGNMVVEGYEQYQMGLEILGPYLAHVHLKNMSWKVVRQEGETAVWQPQNELLWKGIANIKEAIRALHAVGYDGWLSFEDFSADVSTEEKLGKNIAYIKDIVGQYAKEGVLNG